MMQNIRKPIINEFYNVENSELYYNKAVYHNLSLLCCKNWYEFQIDNGKDYKNNDKKDNNENNDKNDNINNKYINELYINTDKLVEVIRDIYKK